MSINVKAKVGLECEFKKIGEKRLHFPGKLKFKFKNESKHF